MLEGRLIGTIARLLSFRSCSKLVYRMVCSSGGCGIFYYVDMLEDMINYVFSTKTILFYTIFCTYINNYCDYGTVSVFLKFKG